MGGLTNFKKVNKLWRFYLADRKFDCANTRAVKANGFGLLALDIETDKTCGDYQVLSPLQEDFDGYIAQFLRNKILTSAAYPVRFKSYKINEKKRAYELLLPISFSANKFYRQPNYTPLIITMILSLTNNHQLKLLRPLCHEGFEVG